MNYLDQVKRVKDQVDDMSEEIGEEAGGGARENPRDEAFRQEMGRLLVIIEKLRDDVSRAIMSIEEANLQHLP